MNIGARALAALAVGACKRAVTEVAKTARITRSALREGFARNRNQVRRTS